MVHSEPRVILYKFLPGSLPPQKIKKSVAARDVDRRREWRAGPEALEVVLPHPPAVAEVCARWQAAKTKEQNERVVVGARADLGWSSMSLALLRSVHSSVKSALCAVSSSRSPCAGSQSGESSGSGSTSKTSKATPPMRPWRSAKSTAASSTAMPRPSEMKMAPGLIAANCSPQRGVHPTRSTSQEKHTRRAVQRVCVLDPRWGGCRPQARP